MRRSPSKLCLLADPLARRAGPPALVLAMFLGHALPAKAEPPAAAPTVAAPDVLLAIKPRLQPFETLKGHFEQEKRLAKIKKPLKSRGSFALQRGRGLLWRTEAPIESLLVMTRNSVSITKDAKIVMSLSVKEQPGLRLMGSVIFATFAGDVDEIRRSFDVLKGQAPDATGAWSVSLAPRDATIAQLFVRISLTGGKYLEQLEIAERNGDVTLIRFRDVDSRSPLAPIDARLLASDKTIPSEK